MLSDGVMYIDEPPSHSHNLQSHPEQTIQNPRYAFHLYGCSPDAYPVVSSEDLFARLLASRSLVDEHTRQSNKSLEMVQRMKPMWKSEPSICDWFDGVEDKMEVDK